MLAVNEVGARGGTMVTLTGVLKGESPVQL